MDYNDISNTNSLIVLASRAMVLLSIHVSISIGNIVEGELGSWPGGVVEPCHHS